MKLSESQIESLKQLIVDRLKKLEDEKTRLIVAIEKDGWTTDIGKKLQSIGNEILNLKGFPTVLLEFVNYPAKDQYKVIIALSELTNSDELKNSLLDYITNADTWAKTSAAFSAKSSSAEMHIRHRLISLYNGQVLPKNFKSILSGKTSIQPSALRVSGDSTKRSATPAPKKTLADRTNQNKTPALEAEKVLTDFFNTVDVTKRPGLATLIVARNEKLTAETTANQRALEKRRAALRRL